MASSKFISQVLSKKEVGDILRLVRNIKHRAILNLVYSAGLRRNELINLRLADIDSKRMLIHIKNSKGAKDRCVGLSEKTLTLLREYYKLYKPKYYLFEGQKGGRYTGISINMIFQRAKKHAGVNKQGGVHMLRHQDHTGIAGAQEQQNY